ncbi:X2-like carbohydrate binding domain-containing protein [Plantactinospora sp. B5E13]|uniref:X2-like carbohydrate binding domain-containing protein n=1 Tax=Plantactinospora sp. B5E13 TaxID=3153758 RepID=UPI00325EA82D
MTLPLGARAARGAFVGLAVAALLPVGPPSAAAFAEPVATTSPVAATPGTAATVPGATAATPGTAVTVADPYAPAGERARRPYMGWSSYSMQVYTPNGGGWITADQLKSQSDAMHQKLQRYGYEYINVDAGWNGGTDDHGRPVPSRTLYPNGLQEVIDHVHANGQKFGLYGIPGISPALVEADVPIHGAPGCTTGDLPVRPLQKGDYWGLGHRIDFSGPCAQAYVDSIADLYAEWGVDFLKFDSVTPGSGVSDLSLDARDEVRAWSQALARHGIWLELSWALDIRYADYWKQYANGWRIDWDVECYCTGEALTNWQNVARLFPRLAEWWRHGGPGGWNDLDSLNVGNGTMDGLTRDERRTAATLWAISAAPFYLGNDLTRLDPYGLELLTNREVIAVNQAGRPAQPLSTRTNRQVWYSLNEDSTFTVALFNLGSTEADVAVNWADLGLTGPAEVRDLWARKDLGEFRTGFVATGLPIHGVRLLTVTPQKNSTIGVNDDDLRMSYEGAWQRNGNREVPAVSEQLTIDVTDSSTPDAPRRSETSAVRTIPVNNNSSEIVYTGSWGRSGNRGFGDHEDDVHYTETNGDSFEYTFVGTGVDYVTETHESQGDVDIYLDGEFKQTVSTHLDPAEGRRAQQVVYSVSDLPSGTHTIRGVKRSGSFMLLDKLDVRQESLLSTTTATFDKRPSAQADVTVEIGRDPGELVAVAGGGAELVRGTDYTVDGRVVTIRKGFLAGRPVGDTVLDFRFRGDHRDDVHSTTDNGAAVSFTFRGVGVEWRTALGPDQGEADVYLDGRLVERVNLSNDVRVTARPVFAVTGLTDAVHTLRIVKVSGDVLRTDVVRYTVAKRP